MKIYELVNLCDEYGSDAKLGDLVRMVQGNRVHKCPKCCASGYFNQKPCDLCVGEGYTERKMRAKMVQNGWETDNDSLDVTGFGGSMREKK